MDTPILDLEIAWQVHVGPARTLESLVSRHREPHRHHHGVTHLVQVVRHVIELAATEPIDDIGAVVAAACYHDAVYRCRSDGSDEDASAQLAERTFTELGWPAVRVQHVAGMIRATARHIVDREVDPDTAVLLDADLAILGADPARYQAYVRGVRAEYVDLDDEQWRRGRAAVVDAFAARTRLFHTSSGRHRWELRARANLAAELASLRAGTS